MSSGHLISVNVGVPRNVEVRGGTVLTSIWKSPVAGRVGIRRHNVDGDRQADLTVHGGPYKAIYLYASEHYPYWAEQFPEMEIPFGAFGENLTTQGLTEDSVHIGDQFQVGSAVLQATQPRMPCFKLALRFGRSDMVKRFWQSGRSGIYFSVIEEGEIGAGDEIRRVAEGKSKVSIADVVRLYKRETPDEDLFTRVLDAPLYGSWKKELRERWAQMALD
jgi:MOSC domain-containing protein YiiM